MSQGGEWFGPTVGLKASSDLRNYQYYVVKFSSTAGEIKVATTAATDTLAGILQNEPNTAETALVAGLGYCKAAAEANVTAGAAITCSSTGRVKVTTTDLDQIVGFAIEASTTAGDIIQINAVRGTLADS